MFEYILSGVGSVVEDIFDLDLNSGVLRTRATLDVDQATGGVEFYDVVLEARDSNVTPRTAKGTVRILLENVNDNLPVIACLHVLHIRENTSVGDTILTLPDSDDDQDTVTLTVSGSDVVEINGGTNGTNNVDIAEALDFETQTSHTILIR